MEKKECSIIYSFVLTDTTTKCKYSRKTGVNEDNK